MTSVWQNIGRAQIRHPWIGSAVALAAVCAIFGVLSPHFFSRVNLTNISLQSAVLAAAATGATLVLIAGEIDLAIGSLIGLSGVVASYVIITLSYPIIFGLLAGIAAVVLANATTGFFTTRAGVPSFISSLGMLGIAHGLALVMTDGSPISGFPDAYRMIGRGQLLGMPRPVWIVLIVVVILHVLLTQTRFGVHVLSVGGDESSAAAAGINVSRIKMSVFLIAATSAGVAGMILSARLNSGNANFGQGLLLDAYAAIILGGTALTGGRGSIVGTTLGVLIIASIRNGLNLTGVSPFWQDVAVGVIILFAVSLDRLATRASGTQ